MNNIETDFLIAISTLSIALVALSGIVGAFRTVKTPYSAQEIEGLKLILEPSFAAIFLSLIPFPISFTFDGNPHWTWSSLLLTLILLFLMILNIFRVNSLEEKGQQAREVWGLKYFLFPFTIIVIALTSLLSFQQNSIAGYSCGLIWLVMVATIQFAVFIKRFYIDSKK